VPLDGFFCWASEDAIAVAQIIVAKARLMFR
jgi:hypothetical protein